MDRRLLGEYKQSSSRTGFGTNFSMLCMLLCDIIGIWMFRKRMTRKSKLLKKGFKFNSIDQRTEEVVNKFCYELRADHLDTAAVENLLRV